MHVSKPLDGSLVWEKRETLNLKRLKYRFAKMILKRVSCEALNDHTDPVNRCPVLEFGPGLIDQRSLENIGRPAREVVKANRLSPLDVFRVLESVPEAR